VILPFVNRSSDEENEYFSDGLTDELISDLAQIEALRVISRTSSMQLKGTDKGVRLIAAELGVRYVLEGSVRRSGNALRITTQLIDARSDTRIWGRKFNGSIDDVFDVQERVSREIVAALGITLNAEEDRRLGARGLTHASAYELYLQARAGIRQMSMPSDRFVYLIDRAVAIEGDVPTLRGLRLWAEVSKLKVGIGDRTRMGEIEEQARQLVAVAPDGPWGYAALGYLHMERGDMAQSIIWFRRAIERDPSDADSRFWLIAALAYAGMISESADASAELLALDPASPQAWLIGTTVDFFTGDAAEAIAPIERALVANPSDFFAHWDLAYVRCLLGDLDAAQPHVDWLHEVHPDVPYVVQAKALLQALRGDRAGALAPVARMDVAAYDAHLTFHFAELFALTGDVERGLDVLALAVGKGFTPVEFIVVHCPFIEPLRAHPRFAGIVEDARRRSDEVRRMVSS
jgi:eukaryotic-like serine/threonine-protein kinase